MPVQFNLQAQPIHEDGNRLLASMGRTRIASSPILKRHFVKYRQRKQGQLTNIRKASQAEKTPRKTRNKKEKSRVPAHSTCIAMCVPTQNARLGYHFQPPSRTKTIEKIIAVLAAAHHALASAAADRASHWAAMPNRSQVVLHFRSFHVSSTAPQEDGWLRCGKGGDHWHIHDGCTSNNTKSQT